VTAADDALRALHVAALAVGIPVPTVELIVNSVAPTSFLTDDGEPDPSRIATYLTAFTQLSKGARP
jgi:hypothetical protein